MEGMNARHLNIIYGHRTWCESEPMSLNVWITRDMYEARGQRMDVTRDKHNAPAHGVQLEPIKYCI